MNSSKLVKIRSGVVSAEVRRVSLASKDSMISLEVVLVVLVDKVVLANRTLSVIYLKNSRNSSAKVDLVDNKEVLAGHNNKRRDKTLL